MQWFLDHIAETLSAAFLAVAAFFTKRLWSVPGRITEMERRLDLIEQKLGLEEAHAVTRDHLEELRMSMVATFTNGITRLEERIDRVLMYMAEKR